VSDFYNIRGSINAVENLDCRKLFDKLWKHAQSNPCVYKQSYKYLGSIAYSERSWTMFKNVERILFRIGVFNSAIVAAVCAAGAKTLISYLGLEVQEMPDRVFTLLILVAVFAVATAKTYAQNQYDSTEIALANTASSAKSLLTWIKTMGGSDTSSEAFRQSLHDWLNSLYNYVTKRESTTTMTTRASAMEDALVAKRSEMGSEFPWLAVVDFNNMTGFADFVMLRLRQNLPDSLHRFLATSVILVTGFALVEHFDRPILGILAVTILAFLEVFSFLDVIDTDDAPGALTGSVTIDTQTLLEAIEATRQ